MTLESLVEQLPALREELAQWREREAVAKARAEGLEQIITGIERVTGAKAPPVESEPPSVSGAAAPAPTENGDSPRGIGAVRRVMLEDPERVWRAREVHKIMAGRGWVSPQAAHPLRGTEAAINRLWKRGEVERLDSGRYRPTEKMRRMVGRD